MERPMNFKLGIHYTDGAWWPTSPTCAVTWNVEDLGYNVTSSVWRMFAHNLTKKSRRSSIVATSCTGIYPATSLSVHRCISEPALSRTSQVRHAGKEVSLRLLWCVCQRTTTITAAEAAKLAGRVSVPRVTLHTSLKVTRSKVRVTR